MSTYPWEATYDGDTYRAMLSTQSTYALMERERRDELLREIGHLVESNLGGTITKQYVAILAIARRSPDPGR